MPDELVDYLIIGGGLSGGYAATSIRKIDNSGRIVLVTSEDHLPYDRVPLSKNYLLGTMARDSLFFKKQEVYEKDKIELLKGKRAKELDAKSRVVKLEDGKEIMFKKLLLATGGYARKLPIPGSDLKGILSLRTLDDCERIKDTISHSKRALVLGGGFIGCELASVFATKGIETTIVEVGPYLMNLAIDEQTGRWIGEYYSQKGVNVLVNTSVSKFLGENGTVTGVELSNGKIIPVDFAVVGVGLGLNTELAEKAALKVDRGIVVNEYLETSVDGIFAAGDVARFYSPIFNRYLRLEHYDIAVKHGVTAGSNMAGEKKPFAELPYFYSYQFDLKINAYGDLSQKTSITRRGELNKDNGFLQFYLNKDTLDAVLSINKKWDELKKAKELVLARKKFENPSAISDESVPLEQLK